MNELTKLRNKLQTGGGKSLTALELAVLHATGITVAEHEQAAADLARLQRIEQAYIKAAMYAEELQESKDDEEEYWGQIFYKALDAAALKQSS